MNLLERSKRIYYRQFNDELMSARLFVASSPILSTLKTRYALWYILDEIDAELIADTEDTYTSVENFKKAEEYIINHEEEVQKILSMTEDEYQELLVERYYREQDEQD